MASVWCPACQRPHAEPSAAGHPWSATDRELVTGLVRALPPPPSLPGEIGGLGPSPEEFADRVPDALTAVGWRDLSRVSGYLIDGKLYDPRDVQILTVTEDDDAR